MAPNLRTKSFFDACPDGMEVWVGHVETLAELAPGDHVLRYRADNGHRGALRIREAVVVARYVPIEVDDVRDAVTAAFRPETVEDIEARSCSQCGLAPHGGEC